MTQTVFEKVGNMIDLKKIKPTNKKYSPNLYKWLSAKRNRYMRQSKVYKDNKENLWIGILNNNELTGARLVGVLCNGEKQNVCFWGEIFGLVDVVNFWDQYIEKGRCDIDPEHMTSFIDDQSRWKTTDQTRECLWCGKEKQVFKTWTETVERSGWVAE